MSTYIGTAETVGDLIRFLQRFPADKPVRTQTISHAFPVEVREYDRCVTVGS